MLVVLYHQRVEVRLVLRNLKHPAIRIRLLIQETTESDVEVRACTVDRQTQTLQVEPTEALAP